MGIFGAVAKVIGAGTKYAGARSKEKTTALGGGLCIAILYFRAEKPAVVNETMFYIVFAVGFLMAVLKSDFMTRIGEAMVEQVKKAPRKVMQVRKAPPKKRKK